jgi:hypothetical protein
MLSFTSVYFFELGLINGLQAIQIKNSPGFYLKLRRDASHWMHWAVRGGLLAGAVQI